MDRDVVTSSLASDVSVVAIFQAIYSRYSPLKMVITIIDPGTAWISCMSPSPINAIMSVKPEVTPSMCGTVRRSPKLIPDVINIRLFGPGVIDDMI